jgi:prevent-host-death family protein
MSSTTGAFETTAAEISRNFGQWQDRALQGPVRVTHHGRPRVVIVSADQFERMAAGSGAAEPSLRHADGETALASLMAGMAEGFIALDADLRITAVNGAVEALLGACSDDLVGQPIASVGDPSRAAVFVERYRWVLRTGEEATFESTAHIHRDRLLRVHAFPFRNSVGVTFTNLTEVTALRDSHAAWRADRRALAGHPAIAAASLNLLGFVVEANQAFLDFIGFSEDQLKDVRLTDLAAASDRQPLAHGLNDLLQEKSDLLTIKIAFLTRTEGRRTMTLSIAPRFRELVFDGLSVVGLPA